MVIGNFRDCGPLEMEEVVCCGWLRSDSSMGICDLFLRGGRRWRMESSLLVGGRRASAKRGGAEVGLCGERD